LLALNNNTQFGKDQSFEIILPGFVVVKDFSEIVISRVFHISFFGSILKLRASFFAVFSP
jgi:hypothetical protein